MRDPKTTNRRGVMKIGGSAVTSAVALGAGTIGFTQPAAASEEPQIETNEFYSVGSLTRGGYASVKPREDGEMVFSVNGTEVDEVDHPFSCSFGPEFNYATVCDGGEIKAIDVSGQDLDLATATESGRDILPVIDDGDLHFERASDLMVMENVAGLFGMGGNSQSPTKSSSQNILPSRNIGGRNAGGKSVYGVEIGDKRYQVKTPERNRYPGALGHRDAVLAANIEVYEKQRWGSNNQIANWHLGYRRDSGRRPYCLSLFETNSERGGEKCFSSLRRMIQNAWTWVRTHIARGVVVSKSVLAAVAKAAVAIGGTIGSILASPWLA